ncbi:hypothetical protein RH915_09230 [Serpentinicella sp. ANB-PHB4]|uniref:hypothetical protein n=1 Tax=Serpentinicella sp. ANB-PHB4 TaxID=3074076 RepID=UPI00285E42D3|nr:hypothetical protein [Serpentinicella sp. ANB-PHB4]MDR5659677.1 hypothetical protein [Serpentinicella sp. ANB-PHB4]
MSKTSRVSSVASKRIHNSYVHRSRVVEKSEKIDQVNPVSKADNQTAYSSGNYLFSSDVFYEKINQLKKEYKNFYHDHRKLEEAIENFDQENEMLTHMKNLIEKYNNALVSLKKFDAALGTDHLSKIKDILEVFENNLDEIGITVDTETKMHIDEQKFIDRVEHSENPLSMFFDPIKGLVIRLYKAFKQIKLPQTNTNKEYYESTQDRGISGAIIDGSS